ncbi:MAG: alpha/beta hydrolase [Pseudomonadota bacterium]
MNLVYGFVLLIFACLVVLAAFTRFQVWLIERQHPPIGSFLTANNTKLHYLDIEPEAPTSIPPIVFLHGASGNLNDQHMIFEPLLRRRARLIFIDRPGHGYSSRGPKSNAYPDGQAATIAALLDELGIEKAIIVGHSFGGAITATFALNHPDKTAGTIFLSPVSHPWPGGINWYYDFTAIPVVGRLFSETLALPAGLARIEGGTACVFAPNMPTENYSSRMGAKLVLRPSHFRNNAIDVANLYDYIVETSPRYDKIKTPGIIITGNKDTIVLASIHSIGLRRDLDNAELVWIENLGHKSDHVVPEIVVAAVENLSGKAAHDLQELGRAAHNRLSEDAHGPIEKCIDPEGVIAKEILGNQAVQIPESPSEPI